MDKAMAYIDKLAAKLGVAAEHVYGVLVKQAVVEGATKLGVAFIFALVAVVISIIIVRVLKRTDNKVTNEIFDGIVWGIIIGVVLLVLSIIIASSGIKAVLNPEYYAIKEILDTIGGK